MGLELSFLSSNGHPKGGAGPFCYTAVSASASPINSPWQTHLLLGARGCEQYLCTEMQQGWAPACCTAPSLPAGAFCLLPAEGEGWAHPGQPGSSIKHKLLGNMWPSNNLVLDLSWASDISQLKISTIHFSQQSLGIFHSINSLLLIPSFYCKISESSSLPPTPTELEMRT